MIITDFPEHTYHIRYDAPGAPELAETVSAMLERGGIASGLDAKRGFDHGTFSLMQAIYPQANVPIVQLSMNANYDAAQHIKVGELIATLRDQGVLIIGSGFSYHDLRGLMRGTGQAVSATFDRWLNETLVNAPPDERRQRLAHWLEAPAARGAHPREDHLIPLMVAVGAAGEDAGVRIYHQNDLMGVITASSYRFGAAAVTASSKMHETTA